tara:strand:+ start:35 stop:307 length:273 start_codon:yes stop_codon:yes gene_type:complete
MFSKSKVLVTSGASFIRVNLIKRLLDEDADIQYDATKPTVIPKRMIDISLAKKRLDFEPKVSLKVGIQRTLDWYKEFYKDNNPEDSNDNF